MKIASKSIMRKQVLDEVQKMMILKAALNFWKEQQKLEKVTKRLTMIARNAKKQGTNTSHIPLKRHITDDK